MKLLKIMAIAASAMFASASAQAGVALLSNLDASGGVTTTSTSQTASVRNAAGFRTNTTTASTVDSFTAWLGVSIPATTVATSFSIYSAAAVDPNDLSQGYVPVAPLFTSNSVNVTVKDQYTFTFNPSVSLSVNTRYFIVATSGTGEGVDWFTMQNTLGGAVNPSAKNSSGFLFSGYRQTGDFSSATPDWTSSVPQANGYSFDLTGSLSSPAAVPEPALTSLLCLGGVALIRRRMKK